MAHHGVRTLYLETSNFNREVAIKWPGRERRFIRAAHAEGMQIVAWYLPGFLNVRRDFHRVMAAIRFTSGDGQRFDGFALDIESPAVHRPAVRTRRLVALSERIRSVVGPDYPLGAIIPTPLGMKKNPSYWPGFPYHRLRAGGVELIQVNLEDPNWKEAFIHPRNAHGVLIQIAESSFRRADAAEHVREMFSRASELGLA